MNVISTGFKSIISIIVKIHTGSVILVNGTEFPVTSCWNHKGGSGKKTKIIISCYTYTGCRKLTYLLNP